MTLIKCFTTSHIDNISACLRLKPEKMILVGDADTMGEAVPRYRALLSCRGLTTKISLCDTRGQDFDDLCKVLWHLTAKEEYPVIDLTGGNEAAILSVGAVIAQLEPQVRQKIRVEQFDRKVDCVIDCLTGKPVYPQIQVALRVEELIALHGGILCGDSYQPAADCTPADLETLWQLVMKDPKEWNLWMQTLGEFERCSVGSDRMTIFIDFLGSNPASLLKKECRMRAILSQLERCGVLEDYSDQDCLLYTYTSPLMRHCAAKAGNILELKVLLEGRAARENGASYFHDCRMSVNIDWDGIINDGIPKVQETRNEIDVVLMRGCTPLFISCKNGSIDDEELYKLNTVANRFGGPHVGKMLIAAKLDRKSETANESFAQRAWDMDIFLVENTATLSGQDWMKHFKSAMP